MQLEEFINSIKSFKWLNINQQKKLVSSADKLTPEEKQEIVNTIQLLCNQLTKIDQKYAELNEQISKIGVIAIKVIRPALRQAYETYEKEMETKKYNSLLA
jgi:hypothetical protein